jgi:hypothetical protein
MGFLEIAEAKKTDWNIGKLEKEMDWLKNDIAQLEQNVTSRMRQISHDRGVVPHICTHTTHTYFIPYHAFYDVALDGVTHRAAFGDRQRDLVALARL